VKDVVEGTCALSEAMVQAHHENLWMVAGDPDLDEMVRFADDRQFDLAVLGIRNLLYRTLPEEIDLVLIDTPPGDVFWARVALASVDYYLCVAWPDDYSAQGLLKLGHAVDAVKSQFNPGLQMAGLVINYVRRTKGADSYVRAYRSIFGDAVLDPILPLRTNIPDAAAAYMPVEVYERNGRVKADTTPIFHALTDALLERVGYVATKAGDRT
jgi:chromosome partitioning protein